MARMKKGEKYIKTLNYKDANVFKCISKTGLISSDDAKKHFNISDRRFNNYIKDNYIQEIKTREGSFYKLTDEGKNLSEKNWGLKYHYCNQSIKHDYEITKKYLSLSEQQRENCYTERELRHNLSDRAEELLKSHFQHDRDRGEEIIQGLRDGTITCPDFAYHKEDELGQITQEIECYEVCTKNYSEKDIESKVKYCNAMNYSYSQIRV